MNYIIKYGLKKRTISSYFSSIANNEAYYFSGWNLDNTMFRGTMRSSAKPISLRMARISCRRHSILMSNHFKYEIIRI